MSEDIRTTVHKAEARARTEALREFRDAHSGKTPVFIYDPSGHGPLHATASRRGGSAHGLAFCGAEPDTGPVSSITKASPGEVCHRCREHVYMDGNAWRIR